MNLEIIDKWLDNEFGVSYTRLGELHDFVIEEDLKHQEKADKEIERLNNIIDELEKILKYDIKKSEQYMDRFIGEEQGNYPVHYYRAEWQKEKAIGYLDKLNELKGDNK